ncbi:hypothetical protein FZEAL_5561 [Fusarium zealandicum]|uniref:Clock-controlled pheromone ccg-4 n=1 Tax=Fusarium zealandicum TaxID=1053134 RepID=A0A8H4XKQ8_9HYPO|nr:hypothetical protein FZEAL_5561 [Fusarium zealandicum]
MKFTLAAVAILASSVLATPVAEPAPWCTRPGQSCWKAKRDAAPVPAPTAEPEPWCMRPGQSCWKAKRDASPEAAPEAEAQGKWRDSRWCMRPGQSCWKVKRAAEAFTDAIHSSGGLAARSPEADLSHLSGGAAYKAKRDVNELANLLAIASSNGDELEYYKNLGLDKEFEADSDPKQKRDALPAPWCMRPGQSCWKAKRDANPEADAQAKWRDSRWCMRPGQSCWKAKRAAEAVLEAVEGDDEDAETKPFDPAYFSKRDAQPWCMRPGQSCWKAKRDASPEAAPEAEAEPWCMRPGQSCWKAKRDILAMKTVARGIVESFE